MSALKERYAFDWNRIYYKDAYQIEYSVTDICNRNCTACSHLAPLAKEPNFAGVEEFTRVTTLMQKRLPDIHTFWLTGGEPTLKKYEEDNTFWRFMRDEGIVWASPYTPATIFFSIRWLFLNLQTIKNALLLSKIIVLI